MKPREIANKHQMNREDVLDILADLKVGCPNPKSASDVVAYLDRQYAMDPPAVYADSSYSELWADLADSHMLWCQDRR